MYREIAIAGLCNVIRPGQIWESSGAKYRILAITDSYIEGELHPYGEARRWNIAGMAIDDGYSDLQRMAMICEGEDAPFHGIPYQSNCKEPGKSAKLSPAGRVQMVNELCEMLSAEAADINPAMDMVPRTQVLEMEQKIASLKVQLQEERDQTRKGWIKQADHDMTCNHFMKLAAYWEGQSSGDIKRLQRNAVMAMEKDLGKLRVALGSIKFEEIVGK